MLRENKEGRWNGVVQSTFLNNEIMQTYQLTKILHGSFLYKWFVQHANNKWQKQSPDSMIFSGNLGRNLKK